MNEKILEVKELTVSFKQRKRNIPAVRGVSFELYKGKTLAIVGESGSGKSVTVKSIMAMLDSNAVIENGEINFYDSKSGKVTDLLSLNTKRIIKEFNGKKIAMVFQDPLTILNPTMTIGKQIIEGVRTHGKTGKKEAAEKAVQLLEYVGIREPEKRMKQYPHQLSGGMRQRVVIAIALACDPEILICDEPTTALDVTVQARIVDLIKSIQEQRNISVIYITHDLGVVANVADEVAVMYAGKIVEYGSANELFLEPAHPYTWGLLQSVPDIDLKKGELYSIPGNPPDPSSLGKGDAFAERNEYALEIDYEEEAPEFYLSDTHMVRSWLYDERAPQTAMPESLRQRIDEILSGEKNAI